MPARRRLVVPALAAASILTASAAEAALSPLYQSIREIEAIFGDLRLADAFANQEAIVSLTSPETDVFEVRTKSCIVTVRVLDVPASAETPMVAGPRRFSLEFGNPSCR